MNSRARNISWLLLLVAMSAMPQLAVAARPSFTGLWKVADPALTVKPGDDNSTLTDEAVRRVADYRTRFDVKLDDPAKFCMPHGMPWIMTSRARDYLIDIYQTRERVTMLFEGMDVHRLIRLDQKQLPDGHSPGANGYSLAHWEGATLVIQTTALKPVDDGDIYYQRSEGMEITERWRLIVHPRFGRALEAQFSVIDPVLYRQPARGYQLFVPAPAGSVLNAYGCNESLWEDHLDQKRQQRDSEMRQ